MGVIDESEGSFSVFLAPFLVGVTDKGSDGQHPNEKTRLDSLAFARVKDGLEELWEIQEAGPVEGRAEQSANIGDDPLCRGETLFRGKVGPCAITPSLIICVDHQ